MDYTKVPRSLIYRDRRSLEEFGVYDEGNIMFPLADAMLHMAIIRHSDSENRALWCMNTAFYICTMILLEKDPRWRISNYETIAIPSWNYSQLEFKTLTLSLVVLLLSFLKNPLRAAHPYGDKVRKDILAWLKKGFMYDELEFKITTGSHIHYIIPNSTFAPRYIDKEAVHDALAVESFNWVQFVNYFEERSVRDIVKAFGSTEEEKHNVVDLLRQASHGFYTAGYNDYPEKVDKLLDDIDKEIFLDFNPDNEREIKEEDKAELIIPIDPEPYEARIKELEEEIEKLKSENKELKEQQPSADNHDEIDELKEEIANLKKETGKLSSKEAAILTITACYHAGGLPPNRENLYPILTNLFGVGESLAKRRLREGVNKKSAEALAKCFDEVSPVIARTLREMPEKLKNKKKK